MIRYKNFLNNHFENNNSLLNTYRYQLCNIYFKYKLLNKTKNVKEAIFMKFES